MDRGACWATVHGSQRVGHDRVHQHSTVSDRVKWMPPAWGPHLGTVALDADLNALSTRKQILSTPVSLLGGGWEKGKCILLTGPFPSYNSRFSLVPARTLTLAT